MQSADIEHPLIAWSARITSWSQHSWADAATPSEAIAAWPQSSCADASSEAIASSPEATKARAIGSIASDGATKKASMVRPKRMSLLVSGEYRPGLLAGQVTISRAVLEVM